MGKLAFVYPGQGSQKVGMGAELLQTDRDLFERYLGLADEKSGLPVTKLCLEGPIEELTRTDVAQPALFAVGLVLTEIAREIGAEADFVAGHSLGEYTAAVAGGALQPEEGMALVCERGRRMAAIQSERPGAMAAIIGLPTEALAPLCEQASQAGVVGLANLNTPNQTAVSGEEPAVERLMELAGAADEEPKVVRLPVGGAFHSELMKPVQSALAETMAEMSFADAKIPLVANYSGQAVTGADEVRTALAEQIASPVRWVDCVRTLASASCDSALELGPGKVLCGLIRKTSPELEARPAGSREQLERAAVSVAGNTR